MDQRLLMRRIVTAIEGARIDTSTEGSAQRGIAAALGRAGLDVQREVRLDARSRLDLLVGAVAVEAKVNNCRRRDVLRQMERYAEDDRVGGLVLAAPTWPAGWDEVGGVPFAFASLSVGWL